MSDWNDSNIPQFQKVNDSLALGGQPQAGSIEWLAQKGFKTILNISPASTPNYVANEGSLAADNGIQYVHYPVDCSNLQTEHYETFAGILNTFRSLGPVFVHCGMNIKSSGLAHIYRVKELEETEEYALEELLKTPEHEAKWFDYYKQFDLKLEPEAV